MEKVETKLNSYQEKVREMVKRFGFEWSVYAQYIHLVEEVAELGEALTVQQGDRKSGSGESAMADHADLQEEFGDVLFTLMEQANMVGINLEEALEETFQRYERKLEKFKKSVV